MLAEVILPLALNATFTYNVPDDFAGDIAIGSRVIVPFGKRKFHTAIVVGFPVKPPEGVELKDIMLLLDARPIVRNPQLKLWNWIADYYLCSIGDVYRAAVPTGLKIESETSVSMNDQFEEDESSKLTETELKVIASIQLHKEAKLSEIVEDSGVKSASVIVNRLLEKGAVVVTEKLVERYRSKKINYVELNVSLDKAFEKARGKKRQEDLLLAYTALSGRSGGAVDREALLEKAEQTTLSTLNTMCEKGVFKKIVKSVNRFDFTQTPSGNLPKLSDAQQRALNEIHLSWNNHDVTLLHGVTSSGKTEIYIHLIDYVLKQGRRAFFLVPEIALTTQLTNRLQDVFGEKVLIYHSKFSDSERVDIWKRLLDTSDPCVVIGARSAVFLPFGNLGLVVVDEEHESSYKQADPAPRYNGRDVAIVLASLHGAKTLLGSATPAIETRYKAETGRFGLVELSTRYGDATLPEIEVVDILKARQRGEYRSPFAISTIRETNLALSAGKQAIFFQNRRGFAPIARCSACAWIPKCDFCDVSMTVHRSTNMLVCHYCGATKSIPKVCPQCNEPKIEIYGYGTERIENEVENVFNGSKVLRMDLDTTRNKDGYARIISDFSSHKADILVGTQMVTKGLDFDSVRVVGILNADSLINIPDFRSAERAFNMIQQVAGRAGRRGGEKGKVIIQTMQPDNHIIGYASTNDYSGFYESELEERRKYNYPPFTRIVNIYVRHKDVKEVVRLANVFAAELRKVLGNRVYGPEEPHVSRVQSLYIRRLMLKIENEASMKRVKEILLSVQTYVIGDNAAFRRAIIHYDVDPY